MNSISSFFRARSIRLAACLMLGIGGALHAPKTNAAPAAAPPPAPATSGASLLPNGDFSLATKDQTWPDGWGKATGVTWGTDGTFHFLHFEASEPGQMVMLFKQVPLPSPPPPGLEIRLKVRYANVVPGEKLWFDARVMGKFEDAEGKEIHKASFPAPYFRKSSEGWVDKSVIVAVPLRAHILDLMPALFKVASGTFDIAQIEVLLATEDQVPKPPPNVPSTTVVPANPAAVPPELHAVGNQLQTAAGKTVWLQGLCLDSMECPRAASISSNPFPWPRAIGKRTPFAYRSRRTSGSAAARGRSRATAV
jgi:hypothetical protein